MGFTLTPSKANFLFAKHERVGGEEIYLKLKEKGVLVRHFTGERIKEYNRITVGSAEEMQALLTALKEIV
jgi:histidinol-phosphate aminotransferase